MNKIGRIPAANLTHKFLWNGKECLIGKFDSIEPEKLLDVPFAKLGTEVMEQLEASGVFNLNELENIAMLDPETFLNCIHELAGENHHD